jgi:hypothetical protein
MEQVVQAANAAVVYEKLTHPKSADVNEYDWSDALDKLIDNQTDGSEDVAPDILVEFTFPNFSLALVKAYAQTDGSLPFLHTHSMREQTVIVSAEDSLNGHEGTSYLPIDGESGDNFDQRFRSVLGIARQSQWDAHVYDGAFMFALATVKATRDMADPKSVTGAQIRDAMFELSDPDGKVVRSGPSEFAKAVEFIAAGDAINYEGASGPADFDENGRALNRIAHWLVDDRSVSDQAIYDCVADEACPKM